MTVAGYHRGHLILYRQGGWRYADTFGKVSDEPDRICGHCGLDNTPEGHDGCLGTLPGVVNACCGHGVESEAYVVLDDGRRHSGAGVLASIERPQESRSEVAVLSRLLESLSPTDPRPAREVLAEAINAARGKAGAQ